ncbi:uncharacterized protein DUF4330 [Natranaerovirga hydrolytica]|uniref:Uncharacterized protein DUF4330 n=1 Tax=Natranaerovirga hydrolytica TaxID=680378 RepID=A0A4R1MSA2_9FIRM|nr:DUF4330 domain-containing protein [Natranaerovirga hydrolytica]TCK93459.1 uncharacterized protein DUF4330 [Natranaerovirga hydrolytica]
MFKKFNVVDWFILLFLILIIGFAFLKVTSTLDTQNHIEAIVTFEAEEQPMGLINAIAIGDSLYDSSRDTYIGEVVSVDYTEYKELIKNDLDEMEYKAIPDKYNAIVQVKVELEDSELGLSVGNRRIIIGTSVRVKSRSYVFDGDVVDLEIQ